MKIISKKAVILGSITTLIVLMSVNSHAEIYKWTDANGQVHYTAQPPTQNQKASKATNIEDKIRANAGKYRAPSGTRKTTNNHNGESTTDEKREEEKLSGPNKQLIKYCKSQRNNLKQLRKNFRNVWIDVKGNKTNLNQEQRKEKVATLQSQIEENCSEVKTADN